MRASEAVKIADKVLSETARYAHIAQRWNIKDEDDYNDFRDSIIDIIAKGDDDD